MNTYEMKVNIYKLADIIKIRLNPYKMRLNICNALRNLIPSVRFKKREKHPWRSDTMGVFQVFQIAQLVPNRAKRLIYKLMKYN